MSSDVYSIITCEGVPIRFNHHGSLSQTRAGIVQDKEQFIQLPGLRNSIYATHSPRKLLQSLQEDEIFLETLEGREDLAEWLEKWLATDRLYAVYFVIG